MSGLNRLGLILSPLDVMHWQTHIHNTLHPHTLSFLFFNLYHLSLLLIFLYCEIWSGTTRNKRFFHLELIKKLCYKIWFFFHLFSIESTYWNNICWESDSHWNNDVVSFFLRIKILLLFFLSHFSIKIKYL